VMAFDFGRAPADPLSMVRAAAAAVRPVDFMAWADDAQLFIVFPELGPTQLPDVAALLKTRGGVASYPEDGFDADALLSAARTAAGSAGAGTLVSASAAVTKIELSDRTIILADPAMTRLFDLVKRLARSDLPVLVSGETGVGKESAAFAVHLWSRRGEAKFLPINCAALPENLLESELFGYEKGAFSGAAQAKAGLLELAAGGTVFFDEVGELPAAAQAKLLRVLENKRLMRLGGTREIEVDLRVVAATNRDLEQEVAANRFRRDLFFRLSGATVVLPPLRDRPRELALLLRAFLAESCQRLGRDLPVISAAALAALARHPWPGNVRELKNAVEYAAAAAEQVIEVGHLPDRIRQPTRETAAAPSAAVPTPAPEPSPSKPGFRALSDEIEELERVRLTEAMAAAANVKAKAARLIGMPLRTFVAKLKHHGISSTDE
jgi:two-component system, NtrC family, response regulator AtoC